MKITKADYEDDIRLKIHTQIEHECFIAITKWLVKICNRIGGVIWKK